MIPKGQGWKGQGDTKDKGTDPLLCTCCVRLTMDDGPVPLSPVPLSPQGTQQGRQTRKQRRDLGHRSLVEDVGVALTTVAGVGKDMSHAAGWMATSSLIER